MPYKTALLTFFILMGVGFGAFLFIHNGYYPIALVNFHVITAKVLEENYQAALNYFQKAILTYGSDPAVLKKAESLQEIKRAALNKLITDFLIYQEAKKRLGGGLDSVMEKIVNNNSNDPKLAQAAQEIYGLSLEDFKSQVLTAQAYKEILEGRMNLSNENFDAWLKNASEQAKVIILLPEFYWDGQQVKTR